MSDFFNNIKHYLKTSKPIIVNLPKKKFITNSLDYPMIEKLTDACIYMINNYKDDSDKFEEDAKKIFTAFEKLNLFMANCRTYSNKKSLFYKRRYNPILPNKKGEVEKYVCIGVFIYILDVLNWYRNPLDKFNKFTPTFSTIISVIALIVAIIVANNT